MLLLCGMIGSGKSHWTRNFIKDNPNLKVIVVNDDALVSMLHGGDYTQYKEDYKKLYKSIEKYIIETALRYGYSVIVDRTCPKRTTRARYVGIAKSWCVPIDLIYFTPMLAEECYAERRFKSDPRGHTKEKWLEVAKKHFADWESPLSTEGYRFIFYEYPELNKEV